MADITDRNQGEVETSSKVNWRGDQQVVPNEQSVYKTSSIALDDLGKRKVVGDRVFRYAQAGDAVTGGMLVGLSTSNDAKHIAVTAGAVSITGAKTLTLYASTAIASNFFAEGYVHVESGSNEGNGTMFRVKSHGAISSGTTGIFYLYDEVTSYIDTADLITLTPNMYKGVGINSGITTPCIGAAPISATTGDYFWVQTWGPAVIKGSATPPTVGEVVCVGNTGAVQAPVATTGIPIGICLYTATAGDSGLHFLQIAP